MARKLHRGGMTSCRPFVALLLASAVLACSREAAPDEDGSALENGVIRIADTEASPDNLSVLGDSLYFTTTYGYATQEYAEYNHDIWVKGPTGRAKRLYKNVYGASWGQVATSRGIYELNEGFASLMLYPLAGGGDGTTILHATYGDDDYPEVGLVAFDADDDGIVVALRSSNDEAAKHKLVAMDSDGTHQRTLGTFAGYPTEVRVSGNRGYVATRAGTVYSALRSGSGSLAQIVKATEAVEALRVSDEGVYFGTRSALYKAGATADQSDKLVDGHVTDIELAHGVVTVAVWEKGVVAVDPVTKKSTTIFSSKKRPGDLFYGNGRLAIADHSMKSCHNDDEGHVCTWDGGVYLLDY